MDTAIFEHLISQETIIYGLFLFMFYQQHVEVRKSRSELVNNRTFFEQQQLILDKLVDKVENMDFTLAQMHEHVANNENSL